MDPELSKQLRGGAPLSILHVQGASAEDERQRLHLRRLGALGLKFGSNAGIDSGFDLDSEGSLYAAVNRLKKSLELGVFDPASDTPQWSAQINLPFQPVRPRLSPDGRFLLVQNSGLDDSAYFYATAALLSGKDPGPCGKFTPPCRFLNAIVAAEFSPDSRMAALATADDKIFVFKLEDGEGSAKATLVQTARVGGLPKSLAFDTPGTLKVELSKSKGEPGASVSVLELAI